MNDEIRKSLARAESLVAKLRRTNSRYIVISLAASVLATLLAGTTAFTGPVAGQGPTAWKWTFAIVAVFTATATILTGLQNQLMITEKLSKATECVGKLRSIDFTLSNSEKEEERKDAVSEYKKVLEVYSEYV